ncbi:hypothetical protein Tco_0811795 [Tanacetum coccineum]
MVKIRTDYNVADLLTKAFDVTRFQFLIASIGLELQGYLINDSYADLVRMLFWNTATSKIINSVKQIHAIVDGKVVVISESSVRSDLLFNDEDGVTYLTNDEIFKNLALMGYEQLSTKLTFQKGSFFPQWKFLIHTILYCISSKSTAWNEFSTNLATAVICLAKGQKFNFSKLIFDGTLRNLDSKKFLMYPRFLQLFLNNQLKDLPEPLNDTYVTPCHTKKVFSNMAKKSVNFSGTITPLFASMLVQNVSESQIASLHIEISPTAAPLTEAHQTVVSQIVFHEAHIEQILPSPTTYQRKRKTQKRRRTKKDTELHQTSIPLDHGADKAVHKEGVAGMDTCGSPRRQETMRGTPAQTRSERVLAQPNEPPLSEGHTSGSGEGRMEHTFELTANIPSTPHDSPLPGGYTPGSDEENDAQAVEILNLKRRVKKLERKRNSNISHPRRKKYRQVETSSDDGLDEEDASKQGRRSDKLKPMFNDKDFEELYDYMENVEEETVDAAATGVSTVSAPVSTVGVTISTAEPRTPPTTTTVFDDEDVTIVIDQTLIKMKGQKAKEKGVAITYVEDSSRIVRPVRSITTLQPLPTIDPKDKGKGVLVEEEPVKIKMRDQGGLQVQADAELAQRLHEEELAELERAQQERQRQEDDTNAALAKEFDEIQAIIDADHELAVRLTHEEQEKYTIKERARLLAEFFDQRKKQLAAARAEAIRNKPPTKTQVRNRMITYLKHMGNYTHQQLKNKTYEEIQRLHEKEKRWIDDFQPIDTETIKDSEKKVDSSSNPAREKEQESPKSNEEAAADYEHEKEELKMWLTVVSDEEETIIRADENTSYHKSLSSMLRIFDRQDLVDLHRLLMKRFEDTTPEGYNLLLWGDLKVICGVHTLQMDGTLTRFNMLVEKRYPLIKEMLQKMLNWKLKAEAESTMAFELLKFTKSQLEE